MKVIKIISIIILVLFFMLVVYVGYREDKKYDNYYEYIDLDNNKGRALYCSYKFTGYNKGGQGSPVCELYDGTIIQVKQYKKVKELKGVDKE